MMGQATQAEWAATWAPYDEPTYSEALSYVDTGAIVLDIGAGDLRFARLAAQRAELVYAVERNHALLALAVTADLPTNIEPICADARSFSFPHNIDTAVLLMRHCTDFGLYVRKLEAVGCRKLITNARWGMGLEMIDLSLTPAPFDAIATGWYACRCGGTGFLPGRPETLTITLLDHITEIATCPACAAGKLD